MTKVSIKTLLCCSLLSLPITLPAQYEDVSITTTHISGGVFMLEGMGGNLGVLTGTDGVLLVDTHHDSDRSAFKKFVDDLGFGSPKYIISTHQPRIT